MWCRICKCRADGAHCDSKRHLAKALYPAYHLGQSYILAPGEVINYHVHYGFSHLPLGDEELATVRFDIPGKEGYPVPWCVICECDWSNENHADGKAHNVRLAAYLNKEDVPKPEGTSSWEECAQQTTAEWGELPQSTDA